MHAWVYFLDISHQQYIKKGKGLGFWKGIRQKQRGAQRSLILPIVYSLVIAIDIVLRERERERKASLVRAQVLNNNKIIIISSIDMGAHAADLLSRSEFLLKKYENHLSETTDFEGGGPSTTSNNRQKKKNNSNHRTKSAMMISTGGDLTQQSSSFDTFYGILEQKLDDIEDISERAKEEQNRAQIAAMHAEVRRGKNTLRGEIPKLRKLMNKHNNNNNNDNSSNNNQNQSTPEKMYEHEEREQMIEHLEQRIENVPDGVSRSIPRTPSKKMMHHHQHKRSLSRDIEMGSFGGLGVAGGETDVPKTLREKHMIEGMEHTEESKQFREEFEQRKKTQDKDLDEISRGLQTLKRLGTDMDEEMLRQRPQIENLDLRMDLAAEEIKTANQRLKDTVEKARSSRHFCIDATLICVLLAIGMWLYNMLK